MQYPSLPDSPLVSIIVCTYDGARYDDFIACVESTLTQSYDNFEVVLVIEPGDILSQVQAKYSSTENVQVVSTNESCTLSVARNLGAETANGDVVAFIDDDVVAEPSWLAEIVSGYVEHDALLVGGSAIPEWTAGEIAYLPPSFYWVVGSTHEGFKDEEGFTRNTFGCNISFRTEVFLEFGGFRDDLGKDHGYNLQGEETALCGLIEAEYGRPMLYYVPTARVYHKVYDFQTRFSWLVNRAYMQGITKGVIEKELPDTLDTEESYLKFLFCNAVPTHILSGLSGKPSEFAQALMVFVFTACVVSGYAVEKFRI